MVGIIAATAEQARLAARTHDLEPLQWQYLRVPSDARGQRFDYVLRAWPAPENPKRLAELEAVAAVIRSYGCGIREVEA